MTFVILVLMNFNRFVILFICVDFFDLTDRFFAGLINFFLHGDGKIADWFHFFNFIHFFKKIDIIMISEA